ncbi:hypothetical protein Agabi119p4_5043 [Agaricus bisporus var. burnettii]|uniref:Uncharacterized protein n=1 Tax=Agaricus bisporus var. burnettii TaxID=192524 RepID=A0A8H7F4J1_AGABI|nr:hypothetical protein Agabi119p4_5043 [Agaricus bisporus var. burnettii]
MKMSKNSRLVTSANRKPHVPIVGICTRSFELRIVLQAFPKQLSGSSALFKIEGRWVRLWVELIYKVQSLYPFTMSRGRSVNTRRYRMNGKGAS